MNSQQFLLALNQTNDSYIRQAGVAGGHFAEKKTQRTLRIVRRVLLAAAILIVVSVTVFAAGTLIGIWNDRWLHTPAPDPIDVVREAVSRQTEKDYTISVTVEEIIVDDAETQKVLAGERDSMLAILNGYGSNAEALAEKQPGEVAAIYARYSVAYDHEKTFYPDGTLYQYFYLVRNEDGNWEIFDSSYAVELTPVVPDVSEQRTSDADPAAEAPAGSAAPKDYSLAIQAVTDMIMKWEEFDDVERMSVDKAEYDPEMTEKALNLLSGSDLAEGNGWTEDYLKNHMAAIKVTYTTYYAADPTLPNGSHVTETATYWLLQDPETGEWRNSEITGFMAGAGD